MNMNLYELIFVIIIATKDDRKITMKKFFRWFENLDPGFLPWGQFDPSQILQSFRNFADCRHSILDNETAKKLSIIETKKKLEKYFFSISETEFPDFFCFKNFVEGFVDIQKFGVFTWNSNFFTFPHKNPVQTSIPNFSSTSQYCPGKLVESFPCPAVKRLDLLP